MSLSLALRKALQLVEAEFVREKSDSLTISQLAVLEAIAKRPGQPQRVISRMAECDRSTTSDVMRRLEKQGFVKRKRKKYDARSFVCTLSPLGEEHLRSGRSRLQAAESQILSGMPSDQKEALASLLQQVIAAHMPSEPTRSDMMMPAAQNDTVPSLGAVAPQAEAVG